MSPTIFKALQDIKSFNYQNIYKKAHTEKDIEQYEKMFRKLVQVYIYQLKEKKNNETIYQSFLNHMSKEYQTNNSIYRIIIDYISGMTDEYFKKQYEKYQNYQIKNSD